jgi:protein-arginine kinase activator protein McsA
MAGKRICEGCRDDVAVLEIDGRALCLRCARRAESEFASGEPLLIEALAVASESADGCPFCGATFAAIEEDGLAGCWKCYERFGDQLMSNPVGA